jgi:type II secretion system protein C
MFPKRSSRKSSIKLSPENRERIATTALEHPNFGAKRLVSILQGEGVEATEGTVRSVLKEQGLQTRELRLKLLEERHLNEGLTLSELQQQALHDFNPCLRERHLESHPPGLILVQDVVDFGNLKNVGRTFLHVAIDSSCCLAFAALAGSADPAAAVAVLNDQALAFFGKEGIAVQRVMAGRGVVAGAGADPGFEKFLKSQGITLSLPSAGDQPLNGFIERFERLVRKDFLGETQRSQVFQDLEALQSGFDDWLERFNRETPLPGYPIMGRAPLEAFRAAAPPKAAHKKAEDRPTPEPEPEPALVSLPSAVAAVPSPPAPGAHKNHEWKPIREIWGFRAVNAALICLVIYFGWVAVSQLLDAPRLEENLGSAVSVQTEPVPSSGEAQRKAPALAEYHVVWDRNLFAVSRLAEQAARREKIDIDSIALASTDVGLKLIGTAVANDPKLNYAIIDVAASRDQGLFREKDQVGKAVIKAILRNNVIIETEDGRRRRLTIDEETVKNPMPLQASLGPLPQPPTASPGLSGNQGAGSTFHVPREAMPSSPEGIRNAIEELNLPDQEKLSGFPVGRVIARDILYQLGVRTGDVIKGLDDYEFTTPGDLEYFFQRLAQGGNFSVLVERRGQVQNLNVLVK